ncbi:MAG: AMP-binding protein [Acidobacteria bacterium]|nr:AMP-binding protein [Acidobacteriota bacterium]MCI0621930.1 AMP-binding protein [Acidobacteriota bacterium]MCI0719922.1 AMP-binding protein [Acidobacteriota bacterium]
MNLIDLFDASFAGRRDVIALEWREANSTLKTWTFGDIDASSNRLAHLLTKRGLRQGDRMAVYLANRVELIDLYLACLKTGILFVPINVLYREREVSHVVRDAEPKAVVAAGDFPHAFPAWHCEDLIRESINCSSDRSRCPLDGDAPAALVYTSGTTGTFKGALLTHNNFASNALNLLGAWQITEADRLLLSLPLFHVHGLGNGLHCWLASGCRMRLQERFESSKAAETLLDFRPTLFFGVPTIYVRLLEIAQETARTIGQFMRLFVCGSAPLPVHVLDAFREHFGHTILERYGMTETLMNLSNPCIGERRPGSAGMPLPGVSVRLLDSDGNPVLDGQTGELYVRGPNVFRGYWKNEQATEQAFVDGYFRTGDLAARSTDGYYTLQGRRSDLIISGGFNVYPREIEEFLTEQPEVAEAAVVGAPDRVRGEVPVAYVVARSTVDPVQMEQRCRKGLASFKVPRAFHVVESLPRNALGKIQKHLLSGFNR